MALEKQPAKIANIRGEKDKIIYSFWCNECRANPCPILVFRTNGIKITEITGANPCVNAPKQV